MPPFDRPALSAVPALFGAAALVPPALARAGRWESLLPNSHVFVPHLLAHGSPVAACPPVPRGDQTTWAFGTAPVRLSLAF